MVSALFFLLGVLIGMAFAGAVWSGTVKKKDAEIVKLNSQLKNAQNRYNRLIELLRERANA